MSKCRLVKPENGSFERTLAWFNRYDTSILYANASYDNMYGDVYTPDTMVVITRKEARIFEGIGYSGYMERWCETVMIPLCVFKALVE